MLRNYIVRVWVPPDSRNKTPTAQYVRRSSRPVHETHNRLIREAIRKFPDYRFICVNPE